jgi:hypothetical protein
MALSFTPEAEPRMAARLEEQSVKQRPAVRDSVMGTLVFHGDNSRAEVMLEGSAELRLVGAVLSVGGPTLALLRDGAWHLGTMRFRTITCHGPVRLELQGGTGARSYGPFGELTINNEAMLSGGTTLARYDAFKEAWCFQVGTEADTVLVKAIHADR